MTKQTPAQKKLSTYLINQYPEVKKKDIPILLNDIKRFVSVVHKIYTEPQAKVNYRDKKVNGKNVKNRIFNTTMKEVMKVANKDKKAQPLTKTLFKFTTEVGKRR